MSVKEEKVIQLCQELLIHKSLSKTRLEKLFGKKKAVDSLLSLSQERLTSVGLELVQVEDRDGEHYAVIVPRVDPYMSEEMISVFCITAALIKMKGGNLPRYEAKEIFRTVLSTINGLVDRGFLRSSDEDYQITPLGAAVLSPIYDQLEEILSNLLSQLEDESSSSP